MESQQQTGHHFIFRPGQAVSHNNCCEPYSTTILRLKTKTQQAG